MEILPNGDFWTILAIAVSALGVHRAAKAERRKEQQEAEQRREAGEKRLAEQIGSMKQEISRRIERLEDRVDENHREVTASLGDMKAVVGSLSKVDERSYPRRLGSAGQPGTGADVVPGAGVREPHARYSAEEPSPSTRATACCSATPACSFAKKVRRFFPEAYITCLLGIRNRQNPHPGPQGLRRGRRDGH